MILIFSYIINKPNKWFCLIRVVPAAGREAEKGTSSEAGDGEVSAGYRGGDCTEEQSRQRKRH